MKKKKIYENRQMSLGTFLALGKKSHEVAASTLGNARYVPHYTASLSSLPHPGKKPPKAPRGLTGSPAPRGELRMLPGSRGPASTVHTPSGKALSTLKKSQGYPY